MTYTSHLPICNGINAIDDAMVSMLLMMQYRGHKRCTLKNKMMKLQLKVSEYDKQEFTSIEKENSKDWNIYNNE
jgi:hypothetical protein